MGKNGKKENIVRGWVFLALWASLILAGIIAKRVYLHPDLMVFFHLPAAVFLILAWRELSYKVRNRYALVIRAQVESLSRENFKG